MGPFEAFYYDGESPFDYNTIAFGLTSGTAAAILGLITKIVRFKKQITARTPMDENLRILTAKDAVISTVNRLFVYTDECDWEGVKECFAPEVVFDMTSVVGGEPVTLTPDDIVVSWDEGLNHLEAIHHQAGNYLIDVSGDEATAFCYGIASHYLPNDTGQNTRTFVGSYDFHLVKDGTNWRIDQFRFNLKYIDGNLNLEGE